MVVEWQHGVAVVGHVADGELPWHRGHVVVAALQLRMAAARPSACRVVSLRYMSTLTMNSNSLSASSSCRLLGVLSTGLPATVIITLMPWSPARVISSAIAAAGYSPITSGSWRETVCPRPIANPLPVPDFPRAVPPPPAS